MPKTVRDEARSDLIRKIGERMMWARELVEPNRTEVARWLEVDPSTLTKIEEGTRAPSLFVVLQYANRFRVSTDYILRGQLSARMDQEMALKLAALHPELVLRQPDMGGGMGTGQDAGTHRQPMIPVPEGSVALKFM